MTQDNYSAGLPTDWIPGESAASRAKRLEPLRNSPTMIDPVKDPMDYDGKQPWPFPRTAQEALKRKMAITPSTDAEERLERLKQALLSLCAEKWVDDDNVRHPNPLIPAAKIRSLVKNA